MTKIEKQITKDKKSVTAFVTAGDPNIETTAQVILELQRAGVDMVILGIPFSDPTAESAVVQDSNERALKNGCNVDKIFDMAFNMKGEIKVPLLLSTYANPIYAYGKEHFMTRCREGGIDGIFVPDVPFEERAEFLSDCEREGIDLISMVSPTSARRAAKIAAEAKGFLHCIDSLKEHNSEAMRNLIETVREHTDVPCIVEISNLTAAKARRLDLIADGVSIGSSIVELVDKFGEEAPFEVFEAVKDICEIIHNK